ncbi:MAG: hypothetical protein H5T44_03170 [Thermoplasmatales archaeon]|nr:hypothetical protein [Thermoplasmatales archaeon]
MRNMFSFIRDKRASEEFTALPSLLIVMMALAIFFSLIAGVYLSYKEMVRSIDGYADANYLLEKLTNENSPVIRNGCIDAKKIKNENYEEMKGIIKRDFLLKVEVRNKIFEIGEKKGKNAISASKSMPIMLNDAEIDYGWVTVIIWD